MITVPSLKATDGKAVLLVDDDPAVLKMTKKALERRGYRVVAHGSGAEALDCMAREAFDVMVNDVQMPGTSGLSLLRAVRERDLDLPVVLVTGNPAVESAVAAIEYGAFQYLIKPVDHERLSEVVERAANVGRMGAPEARVPRGVRKRSLSGRRPRWN